MNTTDDKGKVIPKLLFGVSGVDARTLDVIFKPCIPKQLTPENKHLVDSECIADYRDKKSLDNKL
jgi:hypothetical protein